MEFEAKEEIINAIIEKYGNTNSGCYIRGEWLSPAEIIELIKNF